MLNISDEEKQALLNQHSKPYDGYQTLRFPEPSNRIQTYDPAGDKAGITVNNKGEVKSYTNMGINETKKEVVDEFFVFDKTKEEIEKAKQQREDDLNSALSVFDKNDELSEGKDVCEACGGMYNENVCEVCGESYGGMNEDMTDPYSEMDFSNYDFDSKGPEQFDGDDEMYPNEKPAYEFDSPGPYGSTNTFEDVEDPDKVKESIKESLSWFRRFSNYN